MWRRPKSITNRQLLCNTHSINTKRRQMERRKMDRSDNGNTVHIDLTRDDCSRWAAEDIVCVSYLKTEAVRNTYVQSHV